MNERTNERTNGRTDSPKYVFTDTVKWRKRDKIMT